MNNFIITYNKKEGWDLTLLENEIKKHSNDWWNYVDNTFVVITNKSVNEFYDEIEKYIPKKEGRLLIAEITEKSQGWLEKSAWEWLKENVKGEI